MTESSDINSPTPEDAEQVTYSAKDEVGQVKARRTRWQRAKIELKKAPWTAWFGMIVIALYVFVALFAPWLAPYAEADSSVGAYLPWGD